MFISKLHDRHADIAKALSLALIIFVLLRPSTPIYAFAFGDQNHKMVTDIDASNGIICDQQAHKCVAKGNVRVSRGQALLKSDEVTAFFKKDSPATQSQKLARFEADGHVVITMGQQNQTATADHASYDIEDGALVMTGHNLHLTSNDLIITARDSLKYFEKKLLAVASGRATAQRKDQKIEADELRAVFYKTADGKMQIEQFFASGNVIVTTPHEIAYGDQGQYTESTGIVTLANNVRISHQHEANGLKLQGQRAEINLKTGHSRLLAANDTTPSNNRVKVLLLPSPSPKVIK